MSIKRKGESTVLDASASNPSGKDKFSQKREMESNQFSKRKPEMPNLASKKKKRVSKNKKKRLYIGLGILFTALVLCGTLTYFFVIIPTLNIRNSISAIRESVSNIVTDFDKKDLTLLEERIGNIQSELDEIDEELTRFDFLATIPTMQGYYNNLQRVRNIVEKSDLLLTDMLPQLQNVLATTGFQVDSTNEVAEGNTSPEGDLEEEAQSATSMILAELPEYLNLYEDIQPQIYDIFSEVERINTAYVPNFAGYNLNQGVKDFQKFAKEYPRLSGQTISFLREMPELVGSNDGPTDYLIVLQNESEMRASGGLLTAFGNMTLDKGEFNDEISFSDMWNLETYVSYSLGIDTGNRNIYGQLHLMNLGCGSTYLRAQDSGLYPDLYWTAEKFTEYYDIANSYNPVDFPDYDHMVIVNLAFAENILSLIQPLEVEGYGEVTAENLFEFIKEETDDPSLSFSPERKAIIKDIANAAKDRFSELPLSDIKQIVNTFVDSINSRDIAFYSPNPGLQNFFDAYSMSGRMAYDFNGDYFHFNEAQNCSLKLNKFVRNDITQDVYINDDGSVSKKVYVHWEQDTVYEEDLRLQYDPTGHFTYRAWVRVFAPEGSDNFESDGLQKSGFLYYPPEVYYDDVMNKEVSDNVIRFDHRRLSEDDPAPTQDLTVTYDLPSYLNYEARGNYALLIQKHPGKSWGEPYTLNIHHNGEIYTILFTLDRDKVVRYEDGIITVENYESKLDWLAELIDTLPLEKLDK
jgi:hypothetical protein